MPTPFMCHECDSPTMNQSGICDGCELAYREGNKEHLKSIRDLETRIDWLEKGLKEISELANSILDGEPTTADFINRGDDIEYKYVSPHDPGDENDNA